MYTLASDEKTAKVMIYTQDNLVHGEAVVKSAFNRVSTWLRTQGAPEYIHILEAHILNFYTGNIKNIHYPELFVPIHQVVAFHLAPPAADPPDYDDDGSHRIMQPVTLLVGTFVFNGHFRTSTDTTIGNYLESSHSRWISFYDITVTNPAMSDMQLKIPMALISPAMVLAGMV